MKLILTPWSAGVSAARHLRWFLSYQISGETRSLPLATLCPPLHRPRSAA